MSDNISQLHPQKHPGLGKRIAVFAVLLVFVTGGVAAYVFRDRLTYLMNGNNVYGKPVNTQELADEIDISRPAVRKYLKPNDRREVTVPSALVVSRIARYFRTTPNFLLGFDEAADDADAQRAGESDVYSALGLSQEAIDGLHRLHAQAVTDPKAADLQRLLDRLICSYAHEADKLL